MSQKKGWLLFIGLTLIIVALSLTAYLVSGPMGIEERFNSAVGIQSGSDDNGPSGVFGFDIEGNHLSYAVILTALIVLCLIVYYKGKPV